MQSNCSTATFGWNAASDNTGVAFYDVYHDGQLIKTVTGTTLSTTLTVVGGVTWGLYVNARDATGNVSQASATVAVTPPQCTIDTQPPTAPTKLTASASGTTVTVGWSASSDDVAVRFYDVYRNDAKVGTISGTATTPPATSFSDSGLAGTTGYTYYVVARDAQANVSARSNTAASHTTRAAPRAGTPPPRATRRVQRHP